MNRQNSKEGGTNSANNSNPNSAWGGGLKNCSKKTLLLNTEVFLFTKKAIFLQIICK